ncbi:hypothetical protein NMY22_g18783 [Coprinellus aureogranulatus]|nr:hypothetical protein NMY22_g18783 [Coprinellus aureogranulatus]
MRAPVWRAHSVYIEQKQSATHLPIRSAESLSMLRSNPLIPPPHQDEDGSPEQMYHCNPHIQKELNHRLIPLWRHAESRQLPPYWNYVLRGRGLRYHGHVDCRPRCELLQCTRPNSDRTMQK